MAIKAFLYIVMFNGDVSGIVAPPEIYEEIDETLMIDTTLQMMVNMGFKDLSEYQNALPGHSEKDVYTETGLPDIEKVYKFLGNDKNYHKLEFVFYRYAVYSESDLNKLHIAWLEDRFLNTRQAIVLLPTIDEITKCFCGYTDIKDRFVWYCSDYEQQEQCRRYYRLTARNISSAIHTPSGFVTVVFTLAFLFSLVLSGFRDVSTYLGCFICVVSINLFLWINVLYMAYTGKGTIMD